jgi:hypothetical protein
MSWDWARNACPTWEVAILDDEALLPICAEDPWLCPIEDR